MKVMSLGSERAKTNIYQILSKNIHRFSRDYTFIFVYFLGYPLLFLATLFESAAFVARKAAYTTACYQTF